jgi:hypothetical protein
MTISWINDDGSLARMTSDDAVGPEGTTKIDTPAPHGQAVWDGSGWTDPNGPMRNWEKAIRATDKELPRSVEDLYDTGITPSDRTKKLLDDKKALRAERPGS